MDGGNLPTDGFEGLLPGSQAEAGDAFQSASRRSTWAAFLDTITAASLVIWLRT
ncbi:hypothetical protein AB0B01_15200 [Streptomyces sp. NPDC044571]|uniref:hypothetical protein n=1 Tax=Streptomyces sp. NPDC044571 TaxID=3155371 RepID=UPI0033CBF20B